MLHIESAFGTLPTGDLKREDERIAELWERAQKRWQKLVPDKWIKEGNPYQLFTFVRGDGCLALLMNRFSFVAAIGWAKRAQLDSWNVETGLSLALSRMFDDLCGIDTHPGSWSYALIWGLKQGGKLEWQKVRERVAAHDGGTMPMLPFVTAPENTSSPTSSKAGGKIRPEVLPLRWGPFGTSGEQVSSRPDLRPKQLGLFVED